MFFTSFPASVETVFRQPTCPANELFPNVFLTTPWEYKQTTLLLLHRVLLNEVNPALLLWSYRVIYWFHVLLFFAVYVIYKKNYSFSRVVFLFFIWRKLPTLFIQKVNDSSRVRTTAFWSSRIGVRVTDKTKFFRFIRNIFRYSKLVKHQRVPLQNFSALWDK